MDAYIYGERRTRPDGFEAFGDRSRSAVVSMRVEPRDLTVNTKKRLSAFYPTDLDFLLRNLDIRTVVRNGGFTVCCILNAAFEARNLEYNLVLLRDLVRGTNPEMEDAALKIASLHLGFGPRRCRPPGPMESAG